MAYKTLRDGWQRDIHYLFTNRDKAGLKAHVDLKHRVRIRIISERQGKKWALDADNLYASVKPVLDSIRNLGLIVDDSTEWIDLKVEQYKGSTPQTCIVIETIDGHEERKALAGTRCP